MARRYYIPHPLLGNSDKANKIYLEDMAKEWETLQDYLKNCGNPRWAASHLVRAIAAGLEGYDWEASLLLREMALGLESRRAIYMLERKK